MKHGLFVAIFSLIMSSACTPQSPTAPVNSIPSAKATAQAATQAPHPATAPIVMPELATATVAAAKPLLPETRAASTQNLCRPGRLPGCILSFTAVPTEVVSGGNVTFAWVVTNTTQVGLSVYHYNGTTEGRGFRSWDNLPVNSSLTIQLNDLKPGAYQFRLWVDDLELGAWEIATVNYACPDTYFFAPLRPYEPQCPAGPAVSTAVTQQAFEHGLMIWIESENLIYVLSDQESAIRVQVIPGAESLGDAERDASLVPPADKYPAADRFDKVWRKYNLREQLGWAIAPEQDFTSMIQRSFSYRLYLRAADGRIMFISNSYAGHMEYPHWGYLLP